MIETQNHTTKMDNVYRFQRYIYDLTRKFYLFGRDTIIREMNISPGDTILEMGCGTARNLIQLAKRYPDAHFYGIDASMEMLRTANQKIKRKGFENTIQVKHALAEDVDYQSTFELEKPFDIVFFSYSLSMIPTWQQALECAFNNLKDEGDLFIVDFWDQGKLPRWFQKVLKVWLSWFHVHPDSTIVDHTKGLIPNTASDITIDSILGRYAMKIHMIKSKATA